MKIHWLCVVIGHNYWETEDGERLFCERCGKSVLIVRGIETKDS